MSLRAAPLLLSTLALGACVSNSGAPSAQAPRTAGSIEMAGAVYQANPTTAGLVLTRAGAGFGPADGAEARRAADQFCGGRAKSSIRDRFSGGAWVIVEGCA